MLAEKEMIKVKRGRKEKGEWQSDIKKSFNIVKMSEFVSGKVEALFFVLGLHEVFDSCDLIWSPTVYMHAADDDFQISGMQALVCGPCMR